jgi:Cu/Ag efflux protein CusF
MTTMNGFFTFLLSLALLVTPAAIPAPVSAMTHDHHNAMSGAAQNSVYTLDGVVQKVDAAAQRLVITHGPLPALRWSSMTMGFALERPELLEGVQAGSKVRFDFRQEGRAHIITEIEVLR